MAILLTIRLTDSIPPEWSGSTFRQVQLSLPFGELRQRLLEFTTDQILFHGAGVDELGRRASRRTRWKRPAPVKPIMNEMKPLLVII